MQLGPIVLKLRLASTQFENRVFGAAELALALEYGLKIDTAFIIQLAETASINLMDGGVNQKITERFAVVCGLDNGSSDRDKVGLIAYDRLAAIRAEIFSALLGWQIPGTESLVSYGGGRMAGINRAWLWFQFEFLVETRITDDDGIDVGAAELPDFDKIYAQWAIPGPKGHQFADWENFDDGIYPPDMESVIDFTSNPDADGPFGKGFGIEFDVYKDS